MPASADRQPLNAYLSEEAYEGWRLFAASQRVTVTALLEAIGTVLVDVDEVRPPVWLRKVVRDAAAIDRDRRSRKRP